VNEKWVPNGDSRTASSALRGTAEFFHQTKCKQGLCHTVAFPFTLKKYLDSKEELWKLKYFTMQKNNLQKILEKKPNPSRYYNSITNLKFQHKPKYHL